MAADKQIMKQIETLRLDRPGRMYQVLARLQRIDPPTTGDLAGALAELAATYREEAELWAKSGAKGWKGSEAENYLIAQAIDSVAAQLDNAGGGAALSVSEPDAFEAGYAEGVRQPLPVVGQTEAATTHERLDDLVNSAVAEGRGMLKLNGKDVTAYLKGDDSAMPGDLAPSSVRSAPEADNPFEPLAPGESVTVPIDGVSTVVTATDGELRERMTIDPAVGPDFTGGAFTERMRELAADAEHQNAMPTTWESETMTADGHRLPGLAPTLGQPGDNSGGGYSHDYVPPGGRKLTYADLLQPVPAASLPQHLSHSQANTIGDCAAKYRMQRIEALPQIPQWANIGGTAFHAAVEAIERMVIEYAQRHPGRGQLDVSEIKEEQTWKHHFDGQINAVAATTTVPRSVWRASRKGAEGEAWWWVNGPKMLRAYLDARPDEPTANLPKPGGNVAEFQSAIELELTVDVPTPYGPIPFTAKLDRVTVQPFQGHESTHAALIIRDYKTSYERPTDTTQLGDYAWVLRLNGVGPNVKILGSYFDARRGTWTEPVDPLQAHPFEAFQYRVTTAHAQKRALTTGPTPARPSSFCGGCSVRYACPVMALKS